MVTDNELRFKALIKRRRTGWIKLRRIYPAFIKASPEAQELCLAVNENRVYSYAGYAMTDYEQLVALGYNSVKQLNEARIDYSKIIEFGIKQKHVPLLRRTLRNGFKPTPQLLEFFANDDIEAIISFERKLNAFYYSKEESQNTLTVS
jgi:hypothetical protein